jgi:hypothetical protein
VGRSQQFELLANDGLIRDIRPYYLTARYWARHHFALRGGGQSSGCQNIPMVAKPAQLASDAANGGPAVAASHSIAHG